MILVEVEEPSPRVIFQAISSDALKEEINLSNEASEMAHIREKALKQRIAKRYNSMVAPCKFEKGDFTLRHDNI